ncbi:hypothetical protein ABZ894_26225 [Nocardia beijingensis]|uniref:hypothetical protein n=1 Tax=Nocardia beijingensis TaxID=95162 RepID=UPI0033E3D7F5
MEPLTLIATALAIGAGKGAEKTGETVISDLYQGLKALITRRYGVVDAEVVGVESEPEEPLRRQLLAKKLGQAGAGDDGELQAAAEELLRQIAENAPDAAQAVGVKLERIAATGDIEITDIAAQGGSGVIATDVTAGGSIKVSGVRAGTTQEPPHPSPARR